MIEYLTEHGANVNSKTQHGESSLGHALGLRNKEIIKYLQSKGAYSTELTEEILN